MSKERNYDDQVFFITQGTEDYSLSPNPPRRYTFFHIGNVVGIKKMKDGNVFYDLLATRYDIMRDEVVSGPFRIEVPYFHCWSSPGEMIEAFKNDFKKL